MKRKTVHYTVWMQEKRCETCFGNDRDAPCAYPSQGMRGCLRDERLKEKKFQEEGRRRSI